MIFIFLTSGHPVAYFSSKHLWLSFITASKKKKSTSKLVKHNLYRSPTWSCNKKRGIAIIHLAVNYVSEDLYPSTELNLHSIRYQKLERIKTLFLYKSFRMNWEKWEKEPCYDLLKIFLHAWPPLRLMSCRNI